MVSHNQLGLITRTTHDQTKRPKNDIVFGSRIADPGNSVDAGFAYLDVGPRSACLGKEWLQWRYTSVTRAAIGITSH